MDRDSMSPEEPRLRISKLNPLVFQCSICGEEIRGGPAPRDVTAQFSNDLRQQHPLYIKSSQAQESGDG